MKDDRQNFQEIWTSLGELAWEESMGQANRVRPPGVGAMYYVDPDMTSNTVEIFIAAFLFFGPSLSKAIQLGLYDKISFPEIEQYWTQDMVQILEDGKYGLGASETYEHNLKMIRRGVFHHLCNLIDEDLGDYGQPVADLLGEARSSAWMEILGGSAHGRLKAAMWLEYQPSVEELLAAWPPVSDFPTEAYQIVEDTVAIWRADP